MSFPYTVERDYVLTMAEKRHDCGGQMQIEMEPAATDGGREA